MPARGKPPPCGDLIRFKLAPAACGELPVDFVAETWEQLHEFLVAVYKQESLTRRVALSRRIETLALDGWGPSLLSRVSLHVSASLSARIDALGARVQACKLNDEGPLLQGPPAFDPRAQVILEEALKMWDYYCDTTHKVQQVCVHLDGCVLPEKQQQQQQQQQQQGLQGLCARLLRSAFEAHEGTLQQISRALMVAIEMERQQERDPDPQHKKITLLYIHLNRYFDLLEPALVSCCRASLRAASAERLGAPGASALSAYLEFAAAALLRERKRMGATLHAATGGPLMTAVQEELVGRHKETLAATDAIRAYLETANGKHLKILYHLFGIAELLPLLKRQTLAAVRQQGDALVATLNSSSSSSSSKQFIAKLLRMKEVHDGILADAFGGNQEFALGFKEAWETFLLAEPATVNTIARLLSRHLNDILCGRGGAPGGPPLPADEEQKLDKAVSLFALIAGKEAFEQYYRLDLSRRLLLHGLGNEDREITVLQKLRDECGPQYTSKLESMLNDIKLSESFTHKMKADDECGAALSASGCEMSMRVCTKGVWPSPPAGAAALHVPSPFSDVLSAVHAYYGKTAASRKLQMVPLLGSCEVRAFLSKKRHSQPEGEAMRLDGSEELPSLASSPSCFLLVTSELQAVILLAFNRKERLSLGELGDITGLTTEELQKELAGLCVPRKSDILIRETVQGEEHFQVNANFSSPLRRIELPRPSSQASPDEEAVGEAVPDLDFTHQIDAGIVRLLKRVQSLRHQELFAGVAEALKRPLDSSVFKLRLESLIDRDYICRDAQDPQAYKYAA